MKVRVLIRTKNDIPDNPGRLLQERLVEMGHSEVRSARIGKLVELDLDIGDEKTIRDRVEKLCREILMNSISEEFLVEIQGE